MRTWDEYKAHLKAVDAAEKENIEAIEVAAASVLPTRDRLTDSEFDAMMETGYQQALRGQGRPLRDVMDEIRSTLPYD